MAVNITDLKAELTNDPLNIGYANFLPNSPGVVCDIMNKMGSGTKLQQKNIGIGTILDVLGPTAGASVLDNLFALKDSNSVIKWAWYLLESASLDVGLQSTRDQIDILVTANVISLSDAAKIKALAEVSASRAEVLFGANSTVTEADIRAALEI